MAETKFLDKTGVSHLWSKVKTETANYLPLAGGVLAGDVVPYADNVYSLGTTDKRFKEIYAHELKLSTNSLYLGETKILGTDANTINIKADAGQSLALKSQGSGTTNVQSFTAVNIETIAENGENPDGSSVKIKALGNGSSISVVAPTITMTGATTVNNLTVTGNLNVTGTTTTVDSTNLTVKDNIIELNKGETSTGVSAGTAGFKIDRGELSDYFVVFDDTDDKLKVGIGLENIKPLATEAYVTSGLANKLDAEGTAKAAEKLTSNAGGALQPVYFANGVPTETTYSIASSVPANAKFTDTVYTHPATHDVSMITGLATVATSGSYTDLSNKPTIPPEVTSETVAAWGYSKTTGTYSKPSGGIPKTDLTSDIQASLTKADTALQSESDPIFTGSAAYNISSEDITNWNNKTSNVGTITGITMNGASKGTSGVVDLGNVITTVDAALSTTSANAVQNKIVTAELNKKGTYSKPSDGIPKTDLDAAVQTSLGKADTALQSESDPVFNASPAAGITTDDIVNWNNKTSNVGTVTGIKMNGASKGTSGVVDLGTVITDVSGKADLAGATFTGNVVIGGTTINASNGHIITATGLEIY